MDMDKMFVHRRNVGALEGNYPIYFDCNGVLKKGLLSLFSRMNTDANDYWYCIDDLPKEVVGRVQDFVISYGDYVAARKAKDNQDNVWDVDAVRVLVNDDTPLLPVVGRLLPSDGTYAYTVIEKNGALRLQSILVCWGCHWSDLFTGRTKYGNNVFCLASDLSTEQIKEYVDDIILLKDAPDYLSSLSSEEAEPEFGGNNIKDNSMTIKPL